MGRTKRRRKKFKNSKAESELTKIINLQKSLKIKFPNLEIKYFSEIGWGVKCKKKIRKGDVLIGLPLNHLITPDAVCEVSSIPNFKNDSPQFSLSVFLVYESHMREKSKYFEYVETLPKSFTNPFFCSNDELNLLPSFIKNEVLSQIAFVDGFIKRLHEIIHDKQCSHCGDNLKNIYTKEQFVWAWFIVNTRSVFYQNEKHKSLALAPFLDLFNHSNDAITELFIDFENGLYILRTLVSYKQFDQVFIKYGAHSNLKLFIEYGFFLPENPNNCIEFSFDDVLGCVREYNFNFGEISKFKYNFIKSNKLNQNLTKNTEFSWNLKGLIYTLVTKDENLSVLQSKTYSHTFNSVEKHAIDKICEIMSERKFRELSQNLCQMEKHKKCTPSFELAKNLIKNYMDLLK